MNPALLADALALIQGITPLLGGGTPSLTVQIIGFLAKALPSIVQEGMDLYPIAKNIITALKTGKVTPEQRAQLRVMEKTLDDAFDAAVAKAEAEDAGGA